MEKKKKVKDEAFDFLFGLMATLLPDKELYLSRSDGLICLDIDGNVRIKSCGEVREKIIADMDSGADIELQVSCGGEKQVFSKSHLALLMAKS